MYLYGHITQAGNPARQSRHVRLDSTMHGLQKARAAEPLQRMQQASLRTYYDLGFRGLGIYNLKDEKPDTSFSP